MGIWGEAEDEKGSIRGIWFSALIGFGTRRLGTWGRGAGRVRKEAQRNCGSKFLLYERWRRLASVCDVVLLTLNPRPSTARPMRDGLGHHKDTGDATCTRWGSRPRELDTSRGRPIVEVTCESLDFGLWMSEACWPLEINLASLSAEFTCSSIQVMLVRILSI